MAPAEIGGRLRDVCPNCGFVLFRNPVPGVGALVELEPGIVLIQRGQPPFVGAWALPAGYIEEDESAEQAAVRECREETGLEIELIELFGVYSFPEGPVQSGIIIFYRARPIGGEIQAGDDAQAVDVFAPDALPENLAFRTHREVLARWVERVRRGPHVPSHNVVIRRARREDDARILQLLRLIPANATMTDVEAEEAGQRLAECLTLDVLVAEIDGQVGGFIALSYVTALSGLRVLIDDMAVDPDYQRHGIGAALLEAAIQQTDQRGASQLIVDTSRGDEAAREFYRACGFQDGVSAPLRIR